MNIRVTENLHCIGAVGRKRETLCRFITQDVFLLTTTAECARKLKNQHNKKTFKFYQIREKETQNIFLKER